MIKKSFVALATLLCGAVAFATPGAYTEWFADAVASHPANWSTSDESASAKVDGAVAVTNGVAVTYTAVAPESAYAKQTVTVTSEPLDELPEADDAALTGARFAFGVAQLEGDANPAVYVLAKVNGTATWKKTSAPVGRAANGATAVEVTYDKPGQTFTVAGVDTVFTSLLANSDDWTTTTFVGNGAVNALVGEKADSTIKIGDTPYSTLEAAIASNTATAETPITVNEDLDVTLTNGTYYIQAVGGHTLTIHAARGSGFYTEGNMTKVVTMPAPTALWNRDFSDLTDGIYSIDLNGGSVAQDSTSISVGSTGGIKITADPGTAAFNTSVFSGKAATIVFQYEGYTYSAAAPLAVVAAQQSDGTQLYDAGVASASASTAKGVWNDPNTANLAYNPEGSTKDLSSGTLAVGYANSCSDPGNGVHGFLDGVKIYENTGLKGRDLVPYGFVIGGLTHNTAPVAQMTVSKIAIFTSKLTQDQIKAFNFVLPKKTTTISEDKTWANLVWEGDPNADIAEIDVTANATLTVGANVNLRRVVVNIPDEVTLTLNGTSTITASDNIYVKGAGAIRFTNANGFYAIGGTNPKINISAESTMVLDNGNSTWDYRGVNFGNLSGHGFVKIVGTAWQCGKKVLWPTTLSTIVETTGGWGLQADAAGDIFSVANLSGSGCIRSDFNASTSRTLEITQTANTTWSGRINGSSDGITLLTVKGGASATEKTLTLSGTSTDRKTATIQVEASGSLKFTGTWKTDTLTINGEFGGAGTPQGVTTVTIAKGAKIRADWGAVTLGVKPTIADFIEVACTTLPAEGEEIKLFAGTFAAGDCDAVARVSDSTGAVGYATLTAKADGVYAVISAEAMPEVLDELAKYKYEMAGSPLTNDGKGTALSIGGSFAAGDFADGKLKLGTNVGSHYGTGFSFGAGDWTIVTTVKAPEQNRCIFGVGGQQATAGLVGLRNAGSNQIKIFTANGTDVTGVTLTTDPTEAFHVYTIVYSAATGTIKMNVDGGAFTTPVAFTPSTAVQWQFGGVHGNSPSVAANANSGEMDCFRLYSTAFGVAESRYVTSEFLPYATVNGNACATLADALTAAGEDYAILVTYDAEVVAPDGYQKFVANGQTALRKIGKVYYKSGYFGESQDALVAVTKDDVTVTLVEGDTIIIGEKTTATEAWFSAASYTGLKIEKDFAIHAGVAEAILSNCAIEVDDRVTLTLMKKSEDPKAVTLGTATFKGAGTVVLDGITLSIGNQAFTTANWTGTVWLKNLGATGNNPLLDTKFSYLGRTGTTVKMTGCNGYLNMTGDLSFDVELDGTGWKNPSGWTGRTHNFGALKGSGSFDGTSMSSWCREQLRFTDASTFMGSLDVGYLEASPNIRGKQVVIGTEEREDIAGLIHVSAGRSVTIASGKVWKAFKLQMNGTLNGSGEIYGGLVFGNAATLAVGATPITVTGTVTFGATLTVTGATVGSTVLTVTGDKPAVPTLVGDTTHVLTWNGNNLVYSLPPAPAGEITVAQGVNPQQVVVTVPVSNAEGQDVTLTVKDKNGTVLPGTHTGTVASGVATITIDGVADMGYTFGATVGTVELGEGAFFTGNVWFGAYPHGTTETLVNGTWNTAPTITGGKYVVNSSSGNTFTVTDATPGAGKRTVMTHVVTFTSAIDPEDLPAVDRETIGAITVASAAPEAGGGTGLVWKGVVRGEWTTLKGTPELNVEYTVTVMYDPTAGTFIYAANGETLGLTAATTGFSGVTAVGSGTIKKIEATVGDPLPAAEGYLTAAENGKPIRVDDAFAGELGANKAAIQAVLNTTPAENGLTVWQAYALGATAAQAQAGVKPVISGAQTSDTDKMKLVDGFTVREHTGITVTRMVKVGTAPTSLTEDETATPSADGVTVTLPTTGDKVKYIKIEYTFQ